MPLNSLAVGFVAAILGVLLEWVRARPWGIAWGSAFWTLSVTLAAIALQKFVLERKAGPRPYDGVADLLIQVHNPAGPDASVHWGVRSAISALLFLFGGHVGLEGALIEKARALTLRLRSPGARWFEQRRRTDAASALAAGLAVAFQAPFAAFLTPLELGLGGRGLVVGIAALVGFALSRVLRIELGLPIADYTGTLYGVRWLHPSTALLILVLPLVLAALAAALVSGFRYLQDSLTEQFRSQPWVRTLVAGLTLLVAYWFYSRGASPLVSAFDDLLWGKIPPSLVLVHFGVGVLVLALVVSGFGTAGVFWPVFALGASIGILTARPLLPLVAASASQAGWLGAAGLWGALLGTPLAGAVLVYELTGSVETFLGALAVAWLAHWLRQNLMKSPSLVEADLKARGFAQAEGRAQQILASLHVRDAMVTDHDTVLESEPVADLMVRHSRSKYPFFPVVNGQGQYVGLLTLDGQSSLALGESASLAQLLEAKDLLYREGRKIPAVRVSDRLSVTKGMFEAIPCVAVVGDDGKVQGLLFVHHVRLAYDREMARLSLGR